MRTGVETDAGFWFEPQKGESALSPDGEGCRNSRLEAGVESETQF